MTKHGVREAASAAPQCGCASAAGAVLPGTYPAARMSQGQAARPPPGRCERLPRPRPGPPGACARAAIGLTPPGAAPPWRAQHRGPGAVRSPPGLRGGSERSGATPALPARPGRAAPLRLPGPRTRHRPGAAAPGPAAAAPLSRGAARPHLNFWNRSLSASKSCRRTSLEELALCHSTSFLKWGSPDSAMSAG